MQLVVEHIQKRYDQQWAVTDLSFNMVPGEIVGFLGPNGAGKTTTLKMIAGVLSPDAGRVMIQGMDMAKDPLSAKKLIGYLPESNAIYEDLFVKEYFRFLGEIHQVNDLDTRIDEVIKVLLNECKKVVNEEISEQELNKVKDYIAGSFVLGLETSDSRAEYCAINQILKGKIDSPKEEIEKIKKVTVNDIKEIAKKIFVDENLNLAIIGPYKDKERFEKLLTFK